MIFLLLYAHWCSICFDLFFVSLFLLYCNCFLFVLFLKYVWKPGSAYAFVFITLSHFNQNKRLFCAEGLEFYTKNSTFGCNTNVNVSAPQTNPLTWRSSNFGPTSCTSYFVAQCLSRSFTRSLCRSSLRGSRGSRGSRRAERSLAPGMVIIQVAILG